VTRLRHALVADKPAPSSLFSPMIEKPHQELLLTVFQTIITHSWDFSSTRHN
jgi:hypothetical protein